MSMNAAGPVETRALKVRKNEKKGDDALLKIAKLSALTEEGKLLYWPTY